MIAGASQRRASRKELKNMTQVVLNRFVVLAARAMAMVLKQFDRI